MDQGNIIYVWGSLEDHDHTVNFLQLVSEPTLVELLRSNDWFENFSEIRIFIIRSVVLIK
jgi:hypothetical protein